MLPLLFSPIGRMIAISFIVIMLVAALYSQVRSSARNAVQAEIAHETMERINDAVRAGDSVRDNPKRVLELDKKYCRDC
jgi:hypothetical protein